MRSNVTVGPPIDMVALRDRRVGGQLPPPVDGAMTRTCAKFTTQWEQALREAVAELPPIDFDTFGQKAPPPR